MSATGPRSLEQQRASHALMAIEALAAKPAELGNFASYIEGFPAAIRTNGLGQALASELAGKDRGHRLLYTAMQNWLCRDASSAPYQNKENLIQAITAGNESTYLRAQAEALAFLVWLKKFARANLEPGKED